MLYSRLFGKTQKTVPEKTSTTSHKLLYQAGFIRESTAGRYFFLPLGQKVQQKIMKVIKEKMDQAGAQETSVPLLHPLSLWQETNRDKSTGYELMTIKDRREFAFALGGTAEEMYVDLVRKFQISYKDLPFNLYQFSSKFRDELRARGGLLRVREFIMKDAYSFHADEDDFKKEYKNMGDTYKNIFDAVGLKTIVVESDNGYIGGDYCHEFVVESEIGESKFFVTNTGNYAAHEDVAKFIKDKKNLEEKLEPLKEVEAVRGKTMEDGAEFHKKPLWQQIKDVLFVDENGNFILAIIRGDYDVNEIKLMHIIKAHALRHATDEEIIGKIHSYPGFISPVNIKKIEDKKIRITVVADDSLRTINNAYGGANKQNRDLLNVNIDRDYKPDLEGDIALAKEGYIGPDKKNKLILKKGIEVGNIFQLGFYYSKKMKSACFIDREGQEKQYYMGCYGIGIGRTMAAAVEIHNDKYGIIWPDNIAPYQIHLIGLDLRDENIKKRAFDVYKLLTNPSANGHKLEVLFDDRGDVSAGTKFADADLIGIPTRLVVSKRTGDKIEYKRRSENKVELLSLEDIISKLHENKSK